MARRRPKLVDREPPPWSPGAWQKFSNEELAVLSAIHADPATDAPRLIYADWLEERGNPLGELIRLQCGLALVKSRGIESDQAMANREKELEYQFKEIWRGMPLYQRGMVAPQLRNDGFERGLPIVSTS